MTSLERKKNVHSWLYTRAGPFFAIMCSEKATLCMCNLQCISKLYSKNVVNTICEPLAVSHVKLLYVLWAQSFYLLFKICSMVLLKCELIFRRGFHLLASEVKMLSLCLPPSLWYLFIWLSIFSSRCAQFECIRADPERLLHSNQ